MEEKKSEEKKTSIMGAFVKLGKAGRIPPDKSKVIILRIKGHEESEWMKVKSIHELNIGDEISFDEFFDNEWFRNFVWTITKIEDNIVHLKYESSWEGTYIEITWDVKLKELKKISHQIHE